MVPSQFKSWRKSLGLKQKEAAEKLGLKKRIIQYYETGSRGAKKVVIPVTVELACYALSAGIERFDGTSQDGNGAATVAKPRRKAAAAPKSGAEEAGTARTGAGRRKAAKAAEGAEKAG